MKKNRNRPRGEESRIANRRLKVMRYRQEGWSLRRISEALGVSLQTVAAGSISYRQRCRLAERTSGQYGDLPPTVTQ